MAMTEEDVEREAKNLAKDIAMTKHDAIYGTKAHPAQPRGPAASPAPTS